VELVVVGDNVDMRNWSIRDNNITQTNWQTEVNFSNISFWNNLRRGTVIVLYNRIINPVGTLYNIDSNKNDGYIQLTLQTIGLFNGGAFGTAPAWGGSTMEIAGLGDLIQLRDASGTHIHAIGHRSTAGADFTSIIGSKMNHSAASANGMSTFACPSRRLADFNGPSGIAFASMNTSFTRGLPNTCSAAGQNKIFFDS